MALARSRPGARTQAPPAGRHALGDHGNKGSMESPASRRLHGLLQFLDAARDAGRRKGWSRSWPATWAGTMETSSAQYVMRMFRRSVRKTCPHSQPAATRITVYRADDGRRRDNRETPVFCWYVSSECPGRKPGLAFFVVVARACDPVIGPRSRIGRAGGIPCPLTRRQDADVSGPCAGGMYCDVPDRSRSTSA